MPYFSEKAVINFFRSGATIKELLYTRRELDKAAKEAADDARALYDHKLRVEVDRLQREYETRKPRVPAAVLAKDARLATALHIADVLEALLERKTTLEIPGAVQAVVGMLRAGVRDRRETTKGEPE